MPPFSPPTLSPAFAHREFDGETLLEEAGTLRDAQVRQKHLDECALLLRPLRGLSAADAANRIRQIAGSRFNSQPALGALLVRWTTRLRSAADVDALVGHLERLALVSGMLAALSRERERERRGP